MTTFRTFAQGATTYANRTQAGRNNLRPAVSDLRVQVIAEGRKQTSGALTYPDLYAMDHPYATRHGMPKINVLPLNAHDGTMLRGWSSQTSITQASSKLVITNSSPWMPYHLSGSLIMFPRQLDTYLTLWGRAKAQAIFNRYVYTILRTP
jgi:hypothetical protein